MHTLVQNLNGSGKATNLLRVLCECPTCLACQQLFLAPQTHFQVNLKKSTTNTSRSFILSDLFPYDELIIFCFLSYD